MGRIGRVVYAGSLGFFLLLAVLSAIAGVWFWVGAAVVLGIIFALTGPYVLGRGWRPPEPRARVRAVTRRRR